MPAELVDWVSQMGVRDYFVRDEDPYEFDTLNFIFDNLPEAAYLLEGTIEFGYVDPSIPVVPGAPVPVPSSWHDPSANRDTHFSFLTSDGLRRVVKMGEKTKPQPTFQELSPFREPFRLRAQKALTVALRQIAPSNGFHCSLVLPSSVFRGRQTFGEDVDQALEGNREIVMEDIMLSNPGDQVRMDLERAIEGGLKLSILEEPFTFDKDLAPSTGKARVEPYELILQGFAPSDGKTDDAHLLLADVKKRLVALKLDEDLKGKRIFRIGTKMNSVVSLTFDGGVVRPPDSDSPSDHFWLRVSFQITEDYSAPGA